MPKVKELARLDKLINVSEKEINALRQPAPHTYEIQPKPE